MQHFDYATFRADYVALRAMTSYERVLWRAERARARHHERLAGLVYESAAAHPLHFDDGRGQVDSLRLRRQASRGWWRYSPLWMQGLALYDLVERPTEREAVNRVRRQARRGDGCEHLGAAIRRLWCEERRRLTGRSSWYNDS